MEPGLLSHHSTFQDSLDDDCNALKEHLDGFQYTWQLVHLAYHDMQQAVSTDQGISVSFVKTLYVHTTRLDAKGDAILENSRCSRCSISAGRNDRWPACLMPYGIFQRRTTDVNWSYDTKDMYVVIQACELQQLNITLERQSSQKSQTIQPIFPILCSLQFVQRHNPV